LPQYAQCILRRTVGEILPPVVCIVINNHMVECFYPLILVRSHCFQLTKKSLLKEQAFNFYKNLQHLEQVAVAGRQYIDLVVR
jgi:hypothetical protein